MYQAKTWEVKQIKEEMNLLINKIGIQALDRFHPAQKLYQIQETKVNLMKMDIIVVKFLQMDLLLIKINMINKVKTNLNKMIKIVNKIIHKN